MQITLSPLHNPPVRGTQGRLRSPWSLAGMAGVLGRVRPAEHNMTNREMVKDPRPGGPKLPEPNVPKPGAPVPAPEDDPYLLTTDDPVDSPQPHPELNPRPKP